MYNVQWLELARIYILYEKLAVKFLKSTYFYIYENLMRKLYEIQNFDLKKLKVGLSPFKSWFYLL